MSDEVHGWHHTTRHGDSCMATAVCEAVSSTLHVVMMTVGGCGWQQPDCSLIS